MQSLEFELDLGSREVLDFLVDETRTTFAVRAVVPDGFTERARRPHREDTERFDAPFLRREVYALTLNGTYTGEVVADVFAKQRLTIAVDYLLLLHADVPAETVERARNLVDAYNAPTHGELADWIRQETQGWLDEDQFRVLADLCIGRRGPPQDIKDDQRVALFRLYGDGQQWPSRMPILAGDGANLSDWARSRAAALTLVRIEPVYEGAPAVGPAMAEVPKQGHDGAAVDAGIDELLDVISGRALPASCRVKVRRLPPMKVLTVFAWPEFKVEWISIRIRVGCVKVRIILPRLRVRLALLVVFLYFHAPADIDQALLEIVQHCAVRSVLAGAVVGIVVGNPAAAMVTFEAYLRSCLRQEAYACLNPGLFLAKEVTPWVF